MGVSTQQVQQAKAGMNLDEFAVGQSWVMDGRTIADPDVAIGLESQRFKDATPTACLGTSWNLMRPVRIGDTDHVVQTVSDIGPSRSMPDDGVATVHVPVSQRDQTHHEDTGSPCV